MIWTEETITQLRDLWAQGLSTAEIGRRMGVSKNAICGKASRIGISDRASPIIREGDERAISDVPRCRQVGVRPSRAPKVTLPEMPSVAAPKVAPRPGAMTAKLVAQGAWAAGMEDDLPQDRPIIYPPRPTPVVAPVAATVFQMPVTRGRCTWLSGDRPRDFVQCDEPAVAGKSWCPDHHAICFVKRKEIAA